MSFKIDFKLKIKNFKLRRSGLLLGLMALVILVPLAVYLARQPRQAEAAQMELAENSDSITINVAGRYKAVLAKGDTDDFLLFFDRYQNDTSPNPTHRIVGPNITYGGSDYALRDDTLRTTTVLEATQNRVIVRVSGRFNDEAGSSYYSNEGSVQDIPVTLDITFTPQGAFFKDTTDFTTPGLKGTSYYNFLIVVADVTDAAYDDTGNLIAGTGETEYTSSSDGAGASYIQYNVFPGAGSNTYQDAFIGIPQNGWQTQGISTTQWSFDENSSGTEDVLVTDTDHNITSKYSQTNLWYFLLFPESELNSEAKRESVYNDFSNPDTLSYAVGSDLDQDGHSLLFNVNDHTYYDRVTVSESTSALDITGSITLEAWVYLDETPSNYASIVGKGDFDGNSANYFMDMDSSSQLTFGMYASGGWRDTGYNDVVIPTGQWVHVASVFDATADTITLYLNGSGTVAATGFTYTPEANDHPIVIGDYYNYVGDRFPGRIDDIRIWNTTRTQQQIQDNMSVAVNPSSSGLVANWRFDEGSGQTVFDQKEANHGTLGASSAASTDDPLWASGTPYSLNYSRREGSAGLTLSANHALFDLDAGTGVSTLLNGALSAGSTTITVDSTTGFPSSGAAYIEGDKFTYTGTTGTTFTGVPSSGESAIWAHADNSVVSLPSRHSPSFKLRGYRDINPPTESVLEGNRLQKDYDFISDVKPLSTAFYAQDLLTSIPFETYPGVGECDQTIGEVNTCSSLDWNASGKFGSGISVNAANENLVLDTNNLGDPGTLEFWYKSTGTPTTNASFFKQNSGSDVELYRNGSNTEMRLTVLGTSITWTGMTNLYDGAWHHFRFSFDTTNDNYIIYIDGVSQGLKTTALSGFTTDSYRIGSDNSSDHINGIVDELHFYNSYQGPQPISAGGNTANISEYLASTTRNQTFDFNDDTATNQGEYIWLGSDSQFSGVNIDLATPGVGSSEDFQWEYFGAAGWTSLTVTDSQTGASEWLADGNFYFTPPGDWFLYSVNSSPDLYYIRGHLESGSYTTDPVENLIKTDILLWQYTKTDGLVSTADATFEIPGWTTGSPPVTHWKFDESTGSTINDSSGNGRSLTLTNAIWKTPSDCKNGSCLYFDGTGDYLTRVNDPLLDFDASSSFSFTGWFRHPTAISGTDTILASHETSGSDGGYKVYMNSSGYVCVGIDDDNTWGPDDSACSTTSYADNNWHHFAAVKSGTDTLTLHIDSRRVSQDGSLSATNTLVNDDAFYLGIDGDGSSNGWDGSLDDIKVYRHALSEDEIKVNSAGGAAVFSDKKDWLSEGLVGYWPLESSDVRAQSASADGDPASATFPTTPAAGNLLVAMAFSREGISEADFTISGTGWAKRVGRDSELGDSNARRTLVVWTKTAGTEEPTNIQVDNGDDSSTKALLIQEFKAVGSWSFEGEADNDTGTGSTSPLSSGTTGSITPTNLLLVTVGGWRNATGDPGSIAWTNSVGDTVEILGGSNGRTINSGYVLNTSGGTKESSVSWTGSGHEASAAILVFSIDTNLSLDLSGNQAHLNNNNATTFTGGKFGNGSEHVLASSQYFSTTSSFTGAKTVSFWANPDSTTNYFINLSSSATIQTTSGKITTTGITNPVVYVNGLNSTTITANTWQLVTVTFDALTADQFYIGRAGANYFDGTMDEVRLYNRLFSPSDVAHLYSYGPGPVGWWKMDEGTGTTAYDSSGNGNDGALNTANWTTGKYGLAMSATANNTVERMTVSDPGTGILDFDSSQDFTLSGWVKTDTTEADNTIITRKILNLSGSVPGYVFYLSNGGGAAGVICNVGTDSDSDEASVIDSAGFDGQWHFYSCVMDRDGAEFGTAGLHLLIDNILVDSDTSLTGSAGGPNSEDLYIGEESTSSEMKGGIDDVKIYNYARTQTQVIEDMNAGHPAPGSPVGSALLHYKFDEGYGDTAFDSGSFGADGNLSGSCPGASTCPTWTKSGKFSGALNFEEDSSQMLSSTTGITTDHVSVSVWINPQSWSSDADFDGIVSSYEWSLRNYSGGNNLQFAVHTSAWNNGHTGINPSTYFPTGQWGHLLATYDGSTIKVYANGVLADSDAAVTPGVLGDTWGVVKVGEGLSTGRYFDGDIDEVKIYNFALTAEQVKTEYNQGYASVWGNTGTTSTGTASNASTDEYCPPGQGTACVGPVGEWKMDENTGQNLYDSSGYSNNTNNGLGSTAGSDADDPTWVPGKFGSALNFDGTDDAAGTETTSALDNLAVFTAEAWIYPHSTGEGGAGIILGKEAGGDTNGWNLYLSGTNRIELNIARATQDLIARSESNSTSLNQWQHIAVVYDGSLTSSNVRFYTNGILKSHFSDQNGSGTRDSDTGQPLVIGNAPTEAQTFDGAIDDIKIYNYARTPAQIAWEYNRGAPVAHWKLDEVSWTNNCSTDAVFDSSGHASHGDSCPNGTGQTTPETGQRNNAMHFDNSDDYVSVADASHLDLTSGMSVSAWVKTDANEADNVIVSKGTSYEMGVNADGDVYWYNGSTTEDDASAKVLTGTWHHVLITNDDTTVTYYVNGVRTGTDAIGIGADNSTALYLGYDGTNYFDGLIDDVKVFNYVLTQQLVNTEYAGGAVKFGP